MFWTPKISREHQQAERTMRDEKKRNNNLTWQMNPLDACDSSLVSVLFFFWFVLWLWWKSSGILFCVLVLRSFTARKMNVEIFDWAHASLPPTLFPQSGFLFSFSSSFTLFSFRSQYWKHNRLFCLSHIRGRIHTNIHSPENWLSAAEHAHVEGWQIFSQWT